MCVNVDCCIFQHAEIQTVSNLDVQKEDVGGEGHLKGKDTCLFRYASKPKHFASTCTLCHDQSFLAFPLGVFLRGDGTP